MSRTLNKKGPLLANGNISKSTTGRKQARMSAISSENISKIMAGERNVIVNSHQMRALKSNPQAKTTLSKKKLKKVKKLIQVSGQANSNKMDA